MAQLRIGGNMCQCPKCGEFFTTVVYFDMHQTVHANGDVECMTPAQMRKRKQGVMAKNKGGYWTLQSAIEKGEEFGRRMRAASLAV